MTETQYKYGVDKLLKLADKHNIPILAMANVLLDAEIGKFWEWVNADEFLNAFVEGGE